MKKFTWIAALFAALVVLAVTGCDNGTTPGTDDDGDDATWYLTDTENGTGATGNIVHLSDTTSGVGDDKYIYIYCDEPGKTDYTKIKVTFTSDPGANISQQCVYDDTGTWGNNQYLEWSEGKTLEITADGFTQSWGATGTVFNKAKLKGICLVVNISADTTFAVTNFVLE